MISESLLYIGLLIVVAKLAEGILHRIGLISIVAYTMAGVLLGPVAGIVEPTSEIQLFFEYWRLRALFSHRPRRNRPSRLYGDHPRAIFCSRESVGGHLGPHLPHRHIRLHQLRFRAGSRIQQSDMSRWHSVVVQPRHRGQSAGRQGDAQGTDRAEDIHRGDYRGGD